MEKESFNPAFERLEESLCCSFDALDGSSFIEMDPNFFSMRWAEFSLPPKLVISPLKTEEAFLSCDHQKQSSKRSPGKMLKKCLCFLVPLCKKAKKIGIFPLRAAARGCRNLRMGSAAGERSRRSRVFDVPVESSIHEAVLHCKKSIGNS